MPNIDEVKMVRKAASGVVENADKAAAEPETPQPKKELPAALTILSQNKVELRWHNE